MKKDLTWLKEALIAHRGLHTEDGTIPENSLLAFQQALQMGYAIELDVNVLKDGTVVSFHDIHLKRLCGDDRMLSELTFSDIKSLKLLSSDERIPTLDDVLNMVDGRVPLLIELKPHGDVVKLCAHVMKSLQHYQGTYAIFSFHPRVVYWFKRHHPHVIRGQIAESFKSNPKMHPIAKWMMKHMIFNRFTQPDFISYGIHDLPNPILDRYKKKNMIIISYAARSQSEFDHVKSSYDNVVFEFFIPKQKG